MIAIFTVASEPDPFQEDALAFQWVPQMATRPCDRAGERRDADR